MPLDLKVKLFIFISCLSAIVLSSCSNAIDLIGPYEERAAVFGLLNPSEDIQYIKINKVFTNPNSSAALVAQVTDSLYFDSLAPFLIEIETGRKIPLYKVNYLPKAAGIFNNSVNYLYATSEKIYASNPLNAFEFYHYRLEITLPSMQKQVYAITNIPDSTLLVAPIALNYANKIFDFTDGVIRIAFQAPSNAKLFDAYFYFNYLEVNKLDTSIKNVKTMKLRFVNNYRVYNDNGRESVSSGIDGNFFYESLLNQLREDTTIFRKFLPCKFELANANLEFDNYVQSAEPSIGIVQKQSDYSNIINGVGLFAARRISRYHNIQMGSYTRNQLTKQPEFKKLGFILD